MPKAYWISFYREILDPGKLAAYAKLAGPAIEKGGVLRDVRIVEAV